MTCIASFLRWKNPHFQIFGSSSGQMHQKSILSNPFIMKGTSAIFGSALSLVSLLKHQEAQPLDLRLARSFACQSVAFSLSH